MPLDIYTDSQLVYNIAHDLNPPTSHPQLVQHLRQLLDLALQKFDIAILKIRAHVGHEGNEPADKLAFRGVATSSNVGRHAFPPRSLFGRTQAPASISGDIDAQSKYLLDTVLANAATLQVSAETHYRKEYLSATTKRLMNKVSETSASDYERLSKLRKAVRRHVKKDKRQHMCDHLLQDSRGPPSRQWNI